VIPDICNTTTNSFFTGSSLNTKSKEEIMYAYY
jgi:hypothetical protein